MRTIDDSTSTIKGHYKVSLKSNPESFVLYTISSLTEASGYFKVTSAYVSGSVTSFSNGAELFVTFARTGDKGDTGAQGAQGHQGLQGAQAHISANAPSSGVTVGDLWWESDTGDLSIYYNAVSYTHLTLPTILRV